nr:reverse transcriptase domain-containing protein [Tanacetum cinerariifolium]
GEVKKLEIKLWNLKVRDNNIPAYTNHFQELALICTKFVSNEIEKVDKYISGLPYNIYGNDTMPAIAGALATPMLLIIEVEMGQTLGEMVVLSVEIQDISREIVLS